MSGGDDAIGTALVADAITRELKVERNDGSTSCRNCGAALKGAYCHDCGQLADALHRPVWSLVGEAVEGLVAYDGRLWRTLIPLILRPGAVTRAYLDGQRARFVQPFRLFLFITVIFFLIVSWATGGENGETTFAPVAAEASVAAPEDATPGATEPAGPDALPDAADPSTDVSVTPWYMNDDVKNAFCQGRAGLRPAAPANNCAGADLGDGDLTVNLPLTDVMRERLAANLDRIAGDPRLFTEAFMRHLPKALFIMFPIYALFLAALHPLRRGVYAIDHVVFSLHYHTALVLLVMLIMAVALVVPFWVWFPLFVVISHWQIYRSLRRVYATGRVLTLFRVAILDVAVLVSMGLLLTFIALLSFVFLS